MKSQAKKPNRKPSAPRSRDKENTKKRLVLAATEVFARYGYDGASTRRVAQKAKVNEALIQRYFKGKEGLLLAVVNQLKSNEDQSCGLPPPGASFREDIAAHFQKQIEGFKEDSSIMRVVISRAIVDPKLRNLMKEHWLNELLPPLAERVSYWQQRGEVRSDVDPLALAFGITAWVFELGFFGGCVMNMDPKIIDRIKTELVETLARSALNGPG